MAVGIAVIGTVALANIEVAFEVIPPVGNDASLLTPEGSTADAFDADPG